MNTISKALSELLKALDFEAMSHEVLKVKTTDKETLSKYAKIIQNSTPMKDRNKITKLLKQLDLV